MKNNSKVMECVLGYFNCLIAGDSDGAIALCSQTFQSDDDGVWMKQYTGMFGGLIDVAVIEVRYVNPNFAKVRVLTEDGIEEREYMINVLRECSPYTLSEDGKWGVSPISLRGV